MGERKKKNKKKRKKLGLGLSKAWMMLRGYSTRKTQRNCTVSNLENPSSWTEVRIRGPGGIVAEEGCRIYSNIIVSPFLVDDIVSLVYW